MESFDNLFPLVFQAQIALFVLIGLLFFVCVPSFVFFLLRRNLKILKILLSIRQVLKDKHPEKMGAFQNIRSLDFDTAANSVLGSLSFRLKHGSFFPGASVGMGSFLNNFLSVEDMYALNDPEITTLMDSLLQLERPQKRIFIGIGLFIAGMIISGVIVGFLPQIIAYFLLNS